MYKDLKFFGLLHIKNNENQNLNFNSIAQNQKTLVYLKNAILLDKQLKYYNYELILITNKKNYLKKLLKKLNYEIKLISIEFKTFVPKKTHFYSCHFRVDVFKFFSQQTNVYSVLLDLDVLVLNNPKKLFYFYENKVSLVNDISQNVIPAYGKKKILKKLNILNSNINKITWIGGDFFAGDNYFYKLLHKKTKFYQKKFVDNLKLLSDQTDELFMSAALNDKKNDKKIKIKYGNKLDIFNRYWNTNVLHSQYKIDFYRKFTFLHIPADKVFLSKCFNKNDDKQSFKTEYFDYASNIKNTIKIKIAKYLPYKIKEKIKYYLLN